MMNPKEPIVNPKSFCTKAMFTRILNKVEVANKVLKEIKSDFSQLSQIVTSHFDSMHLETQ